MVRRGWNFFVGWVDWMSVGVFVFSEIVVRVVIVYVVFGELVWV